MRDELGFFRVAIFSNEKEEKGKKKARIVKKS